MTLSLPLLLAFLSLHGVCYSSELLNKISSQDLSNKKGHKHLNSERTPKDFVNKVLNTFGSGSSEKSRMNFIHTDKTKSGRADLKKGAKAPASLKHTVVFATKQKKLDQIESILRDVSDPSSVNFGKFLTKAEVMALTANPDATREITEFLLQMGVKIVETTKSGEYITAEATVAQWEGMFDTEFYEFSLEGKENQKVVRAEKYSLPHHLAKHVSCVLNTVQLPTSAELREWKVEPEQQKQQQEDKAALGSKEADQKPSAANRKRDVLSDEIVDGFVTPALLRQTYGIPAEPTNGLGSQSIFSFADIEYVSTVDLRSFQDKFNLPWQNLAGLMAVHGFNGDLSKYVGVTPNICSNYISACLEGNRGFEYAMAMAPQTPTYYYGGHDFLTSLTHGLLYLEEPPLVNIIPHTASERETHMDIKHTFNNEAMKLAAMGGMASFYISLSSCRGLTCAFCLTFLSDPDRLFWGWWSGRQKRVLLL